MSTPYNPYFRDEFRMSSVSNKETLKNLTDEEKIIVQRLAFRCYHLPGYSYRQDLVQFWCNNHPILGFCFQHRLHPFTLSDRFFLLLGSIAFGLAATSGVILWFYIVGQESVDLGAGVAISPQVVALWAAAINTGFDLALWYLQSCPCCQPGFAYDLNERCYGRCWIWVGRHMVTIVVVIATIMAVAVVLLRSWVAEEEGSGTGIHSFSFLLTFLIELVFSFLIFDPLVAFVLFTGVLGCFRLPVLGGRPWEMRSEESGDDFIGTRAEI